AWRGDAGQPGIPDRATGGGWQLEADLQLGRHVSRRSGAGRARLDEYADLQRAGAVARVRAHRGYGERGRLKSRQWSGNLSPRPPLGGEGARDTATLAAPDPPFLPREGG